MLLDDVEVIRSVGDTVCNDPQRGDVCCDVRFKLVLLFAVEKANRELLWNIVALANVALSRNSRRVRVVKAQQELPVVNTCVVFIQQQRLHVPNMEVATRFRWKPGYDTPHNRVCT
jgi:hypothetical protein